MSVEIADIRAGLAANLSANITDGQVSAYRLESPTPPSLLVVGFDKMTPIAFGRGSFEVPFIVQGLAGAPTHKGAQIRLDKWLSPMGSENVWAALESDRTLGGKVQDLAVMECDGAQFIETPHGEFLGSTWHVRIQL